MNTNTNSNLPAVRTGALRITTTTGEEMIIAPGHSLAGADSGSVVDMLPSGGMRPLPRLIVAQPKDSRGIDISLQGQFIIQQSDQAVNDAGENERIRTYSAPLGTRLTTARVVGYTLNRSCMPKFDPRATGPDANRPLCHSENFLTPDAQYDGKFSHQCVTFDPKRGSLVAACPMAAWGARDKQTGKSQPPACNETYILALAIPVDSQWIVCEAYFKSSSAKSGRTLIQQLRALELRSYPLYTYPVELAVTDAGVGYSMTGRLQLPPTTATEQGVPDEADIEALEAGVQTWAAAIQVRNDRANRVYAEDTGTENATGSAADAAFGPSRPASTNPVDQQVATIIANISADTPAPTAVKPAPTKLPKKAPMV